MEYVTGGIEYAGTWEKQELGLARAKGRRQDHKMHRVLQQAGKERGKQD